MNSRNSLCPCGSGAKYKRCCLAKDEAQRKPHTGDDALIVCMPTRGSVSVETLLSIEHNMGGVKHAVLRIARKPVAMARNMLAQRALEVVKENPFDFTPRETFILWVDDDAWLPPGLVPTMISAMRDLHRLDALFAWFCTRMPYAEPVAYRRFDDMESFPKLGIDCQHGDVVPIEMAGFHTVLMRARLLEKIGPEPFTPISEQTDSEDWAFCRRAKAIGALMAVGTSLPSVHVDPRDGTGYAVGMPAGMMDGNSMRALSIEHLSGTGSIKTGENRKYGLDAVETASAKADAETKSWLDAEMEQRRRDYGGYSMKGNAKPKTTGPQRQPLYVPDNELGEEIVRALDDAACRLERENLLESPPPPEDIA